MLQHQQMPCSFDLIVVTYLGNLDTPVEQQLRSNVVLVLVHVVEEAAVGHELGDQLDGGAQADAQQTHQVGVLHAGHDQGLLGERGEEEKEGLRRLLHFMAGNTEVASIPLLFIPNKTLYIAITNSHSHAIPWTDLLDSECSAKNGKYRNIML